MKSMQRIWEILGWVVAGYTLYEKIQTLRQIKNDIIPYLSPEQQTMWNKYLGTPAPPPVLTSSNVVPAISQQPANTLTQLKAGT